MTVSELALWWCCVQVTVLAVAALGLGAIVGRRRPAAGAAVAASALIAVAGLTAAAFCPLPAWSIEWDGFSLGRATQPAEIKADGPAPAAAITISSLPADDNDGSDTLFADRPTAAHEQPDSFLAKTSGTIANNWGLFAAVVYLVGVGAMALRIGWGLAAVRGYRRNSRPVTDQRLCELVDVVCAELGCRQDVELRQSAQLGTPATIGWRRPILLLPSDWPNWTDDELHAVLAHEIAHVRRSDFATWMLAQIGVALHFYHPLVHWLANRLRLEQELAADAAAARLLGGQRKYVTTLAAMALRQSDALVAWPARAFLPTSKTFLRRIEMLHRSKSLWGDVSRPFVCFNVTAVALAAVCAAGFRGSAAGDDRAAVANDSSAPGARQRAARPVQESPFKMAQTLNHLKVLALGMHNYHDKNKHFPPAAVMEPDGKTPHSWRVELLPYLDQQTLYEQYRMNEPWDSPNNKRVLEQMPDIFRSPYDDPKSTNSGYYVFTGPARTMFEGDKGIAMSEIVDGTSNTLLLVESKQNVPWTKPEDIPFDANKQLSPNLRHFVRGQFAAALCDGSVRTFDRRVNNQLELLIKRDDLRTIDWGRINGGGTTPPGTPAKSAEVPNRSIDKLRMLALAMHNWHDVFGHFPASAVKLPDGKEPRSWRVELLPFVGAANLYQQYRKDEPWDGPNNKKLIDKMPDVYRSPFDDPKSTNGGYYVLVGPGTMFDGTKGIPISDTPDGTSNTILIVESKRNIPWTKPEDIPFDPDKPLPKLGGFLEGIFLAVMADGAVRSYRTGLDPNELKGFIIRNDGQPAKLGQQPASPRRRRRLVGTPMPIHPGGLAEVAFREPVLKELGIEHDETKIAEILKVRDAARQELQSSLRKLRGNGSTSSDAIARLQAKYDAELNRILTPEQYTRVQQINWQWAGIRALWDPDVVRALDITKEQQQKLMALALEAADKMREVSNPDGKRAPTDDKDVQAKLQALRTERDNRINEILSKPQQEKFAKLIGKPFDVALLRAPMRLRAGETGLVVDIKDPGVQVTVNGGISSTVTASGHPRKQEVSIAAGEYDLTITVLHGPQLSTKESFSLMKGQQRNVEVSIVDKQVVVKLDNQPLSLVRSIDRFKTKKK